MTRYDRESDTLIVTLAPRSREVIEYRGPGVVAVVNRSGQLVEIRLSDTRRFMERARDAGVPMPGAPRPQAEAERMVWVQADSTMISAFGYDEDARVLEVAFRRGGTYRYYDVPPEEFKGLRLTLSKGRYMHDHIIGVYPWVRITRSAAPLGER
jgi:hypothetical protein